jgi:cob(I)alamin adenosyltransferase
VSKADAATEAYGTVDEAVAALGVARAACGDGDATTAAAILRLQRDLFVVGADLATNPFERERLQPGVSLVTVSMVDGLEREIDRLVEAKPLPNAFVVPGANALSAALDVARSVVRRAERRVVELESADRDVNPEVRRYLNRLSDLLFVVARSVAGDGDVPSREA